MAVHQEKRILEDYLATKDLKYSRQREEILDVFLSTDRHPTANELYNSVRKKYPRLGFATIYRTLKLLCACGLGRELKLEDGTTRYEHLYGHRHHDHLICTKCGRFVEVVDSAIERLQEKLFKRYGFYPQRHRLELYGICRNCKK
ncbi:MAG: transcriptional repressor [Verrucomicrobiota bacterium]